MGEHMKLTKYQEEASKGLESLYLASKNAYLNAVCGAGKTEMMVPIIQLALNQHKRVCFVTPRTTLTIELAERLQQYLDTPITLVYGGHCQQLDGQMVVCTTHQLQKYKGAFDLLILDEMDAFPFCGNKLLMKHLLQACTGVFICMSATKNRFVDELIDVLDLHTVDLLVRYHLHPIPVPTTCFMLPWSTYQLRRIVEKYKNHLIIFVDTVKQAKRLAKKLHLYHVGVVYANAPGYMDQLEQFRCGTLDCLISTSVLERGVTFVGVHVLIYRADKPFFTQTMLVQMAGRVGRKEDAWEGQVIFFVEKVTRAMDETKKAIEQANRSLSHLPSRSFRGS